jgi:hypothetical protein
VRGNIKNSLGLTVIGVKLILKIFLEGEKGSGFDLAANLFHQFKKKGHIVKRNKLGPEHLLTVEKVPEVAP